MTRRAFGRSMLVGADAIQQDFRAEFAKLYGRDPSEYEQQIARNMIRSIGVAGIQPAVVDLERRRVRLARLERSTVWWLVAIGIASILIWAVKAGWI